MKAVTFHNATMCLVSAYGELLAEMAAEVAALRQQVETLRALQTARTRESSKNDSADQNGVRGGGPSGQAAE
jgi:hypothetical protein